MNGRQDDNAASDTPLSDAAEYLQTDTNPPERLGLCDIEVARQLERCLAAERDRLCVAIILGNELADSITRLNPNSQDAKAWAEFTKSP